MESQKVENEKGLREGEVKGSITLSLGEDSPSQEENDTYWRCCVLSSGEERAKDGGGSSA